MLLDFRIEAFTSKQLAAVSMEEKTEDDQS